MPKKNKKSILLVEDEIVIAMATSQKIKSFGYDVITANKGEKAVQIALENENINLILMDINLGKGIDGTESAKQILAQRHIPIVFMTSHSEEEYVMKVKEITRYGYIIKNSDDFVLKSSIEMAFELFYQLKKTKESEEKFKSYIDNSPFGIFVTDENGTYIDVNETSCQITEYSKNELIGMNHEKITPFYYQEKVKEEFSNFINNGKITIDLPFKKKDGSINFWNINGVKLSEKRFMAFATDITEKIKAEKLLKAEKDFSQKLISSMSDGFSLLDTNGKQIDVNESFCKMTGFSKEELIGISAPNFPYWPPEEFDNIQRAFQKSLELNFENFELVFMKKNEERFPVIVSPSALKDNNGNIINFMATIKDITERKKAEEKLKESEERLALIYNHSSDLMLLISVESEDNFRVVSANKTYIDTVLSYKKDFNTNDFFGKNLKEILLDVFQLDLKTCLFVIDKYNEAIKSRKTIYYEESLDYINEQFFTEVNLTPIFDNNNKCTHLLYVSRNITDRKKEEEKIKESENRFKNLAGASFECIIIHKDGIILDANQVFADLLGFDKPEDLIGKNGLEIMNLSPKSKELILLHMNEHKSDAYEISGTNGNGELYHGEMKGKDIIYKGQNARVVAMRDITERKKTEEKLRESEERFSLAIKGCASGVWDWIEMGDLNWWSPKFYELLGYEEFEIEANTNNFLSLLHPDDFSLTMENIENHLKNKANLQTEHRLKIKSGEYKWFLGSGQAIWDEYGNATRMVGSIFDIDDKKKAEQRLIQYTSELEFKNKELENYLYITSHDLRSPLVNIHGFAQRLNKKFFDLKELAFKDNLEPEIVDKIEKITNQEIPKALDFIFTNVTKMDSILNSLLKISRTGRLKMIIKKIDMDKLITNILKSFSFQIEDSNTEIIFNKLHDCYGDYDQINQLFSNIIENAIKYRNKQRKLILELSSQINQNIVLYSIKDTGIGISTPHLDKIWDVFYRVDSSSSESGDGIGLSIVKKISYKNKGNVRVESEEGLGSIFYIELQNSEFSE